MTNKHLPEELLKMVLWALKLPAHGNASLDDNKTSRKTLVACMLASSTLHRLAQPVLYHTIRQEELQQFVQTCIRRPDLAGLVRELRDCETGPHFELSVDLLDDIIVWRDVNIELCESWGRPYEIPPIGFLLLMCTRLETLVLERDVFTSCFPPGQFLAECTALVQGARPRHAIPLAALRKFVTYEAPKYESCIGEDEDDNWFPSLLRLPQIETIALCELSGVEFDMPIPTLDGKFMEDGMGNVLDEPYKPSYELVGTDTSVPWSPSNLKHLTIGSPNDGGHTAQIALGMVLTRLLRNCPLLESLDVTFVCGANEGSDDWSSLGRTLSSYGPSLREIHVHDPFEIVNPSQDGAPINLVSMTQLRSVTLPIRALLSESHHGGFDAPGVSLSNILPASLTQLQIVDDYQRLQAVQMSSHKIDLHAIQIRREGQRGVVSDPERYCGQ